MCQGLFRAVLLLIVAYWFQLALKVLQVLTPEYREHGEEFG